MNANRPIAGNLGVLSKFVSHLAHELEMPQLCFSKRYTCEYGLMATFASADEPDAIVPDEAGERRFRLRCPDRRGRLSALSVFLCKSVLYGGFVRARRALNSQKRRLVMCVTRRCETLTASLRGARCRTPPGLRANFSTVDSIVLNLSTAEPFNRAVCHSVSIYSFRASGD